MKVLIACFKPKGEVENLFVPELISALEKRGIDMTWSSEEFWIPTKTYDVVHIQWPEGVVDGGACGMNAVNAVKWRLKCWHDCGVKIVLTRHNENRHYATSGIYAKLYRTIEEMCDGIIHMGNYSKDSLARVLNNQLVRHFVIPHHVYSSVNRSMGQAEARKALGLLPKDRIVLAFGVFRADEERELVLAATKELKRQGIKIIAPNLFGDSIRRGNKWERYFALRHRLRFLKYGLYLGDYGRVSEDHMAKLFAACDVILVPRRKILNSGNVPMGCYFGKVVVGPDRGNVGEILRGIGNPVFDPDCCESVVDAILRGLDMSEKGKGAENRAYAEKHWRVEEVGRQIDAAYSELMENR